MRSYLLQLTFCLLLSGILRGETIIVTTFVDEDNGQLGGGSGISLREAIRYGTAGSIIHLPQGTYTLSIIGPGEDAGAKGDLDVIKDLSIEGAGPDLSKINTISGWNDRVFDVWNSSARVRISGIGISGGHGSEDAGGGIRNFESTLIVSNCAITGCSGTTGGGIESGFRGTAVLTVVDSNITGNQAVSGGGGISCSGGIATILRTSLIGNSTVTGGAGIHFDTAMVPLNVTDCTISKNVASWNGGGGAEIDDDCSVIFTNTFITGNTVEFSGGGIFNAGTVKLIDCSVSGNSSNEGSGGGIASIGTVFVISSTIDSNTAATDGGGVAMFNGHRLEISNSTISGNTAKENGGGLYLDLNNVQGGEVSMSGTTITNNICDSDNNGSGDGGGTFWSRSPTTLQNTIVAKNLDTPNNAGPGRKHPDYSGAMISAGHNLIGETTGTTVTGIINGNKLNVDALIGPLENNGGRTRTHALLTGSPALNAGNNNLVAGNVNYDQRGSDFLRIRSGTVDIGAYESQPLTTLQSWRQTYFGNAGNFGEGDNSFDLDKDGLCNLLEFALRLDPTSPVSPTMSAPGTGIAGLPLVFRTSAATGSQLTIEFVRRKGNNGILYNVQFATIPGQWSANAEATETVTSIDAAWERVRVTDSLINTHQRFVRLQVHAFENSPPQTIFMASPQQTSTPLRKTRFPRSKKTF